MYYLINFIAFILNIVLCVSLKDNPDTYLDVPGIISRHGYLCESHTVVTDDGFILTLHRIPYGKQNNNVTERRQPIFLQHGLMADSSCFVISNEKSLAFILADAGYDVWMNNVRGTDYSKRHIKYNPNQYQFWDWSWDEIADYDIPKALKYVAFKTNQIGNILYIGHSMGTTVFFASMASKFKNNQYVKAMFALAPVSYMSHIKGPLNLISIFSRDAEWIFKSLGEGEFIPDDEILRIFIKYGCDIETNIKYICENVIFTIVGFDSKQFNITLLPLLLAHLPSSTSVRTVVHFAQEVQSGRFRRYDFGPKENMKKYGTLVPPEYNIRNISVPVSLYWAQNDWLSQEQDVNKLWAELPKKSLFYTIPFAKFNHLDFLFANDVLSLLYDKLLKDLKKYS